MRALRRFSTTQVSSRTFRFAQWRQGTALEVEVGPTGVIIRAGGGTFLPRDRAAFVRYLADEGFIPERYRGVCSHPGGSSPRLEWTSETTPPPPPIHSLGRVKRADAFMKRLLAYAFIAWLIELTALFLLA